jgi:hypothetical protein
MSQCVARTKDFERCKNDAEKGSLFCRRHRWWWLVTLFGAFVVITTIGANIATMFGVRILNPFGTPVTSVPTMASTASQSISVDGNVFGPIVQGNGNTVINNSTNGFSPLIHSPVSFDSFTTDDFQSIGNGVSISKGKIFWDVSRRDGNQFLYRNIPTFNGNVRLSAVGQINDWTNNCAVGVGIGTSLGSGIAINFGYYGGGCGITKATITASGATFNMQEIAKPCNFNGDWLLVDPNTPVRASMATDSSSVELSVDGVGKSNGVLNYHGDYNLLWIGMSGDGDYPSCSGEIDSIKVEPLP